MSDEVFRPRIRTILLIVNLAILALPLAGIAGLRLYENELIRGTEAQLLVQGALVREMYLLGYAEAAGLARSVEAEPNALVPSLDITREDPRPPAPEAVPPSAPVDAAAAAAGTRMQPALQAAVRETLVGIRVTDAAGTVVATSGSELGLSLAAREEVAGALRGEAVSLLRTRNSDEPVPPLASISRGQRYRVFAALPVRLGGRSIGAVVLSRTPLDIAKALWLIRRPLAVGALSVVAVVVLVTVLTSLTISRPMRGLVAQTRRVAAGERGALAAPRGVRTLEVSQLWDAVSGMAGTLERRAEYIRTFASHVSHEFKTPLTTLRGSLELLREHGAGMSPDEQARFLANAEEATARLDRLVGRLLELARADVTRPGDAAAGLRPILEGVRERYARTGTQVVVTVEPNDGAVAMSGEILEEIVTNLVDNARQHGGEKSSVRIDAHLEADLNRPVWEVVVEDDGRGVSAANASRIFTPFFTTARDRGGSGLGLAIVRSLLEAHGGSIAFVPGRLGAAFRLIIPAKGTSSI